MVRMTSKPSKRRRGVNAEINDTKEANEISACYIPSPMKIIIVKIIIVILVIGVIVIMMTRQRRELLMCG